MTETEVKLWELQKNIAHLSEISEDGWVLKWGNSPETAFEIVCRGANAVQVERLESALNAGHQKAISSLK